MKQLIKYILDFSRALNYTQSVLYQANTLSDELLILTEFKNGSFFTLLPEDSNLERLYEFEAGLILPQKQKLKYRIDNIHSTYSLIPHVNKELSDIILEKITKEDLFCVIDDVLRLPTDVSHNNLFYTHGWLYGKEIYYLLEKNNVSTDLILDGLRASNAVWHSLCILTKCTVDSFKKNNLSLEKIKECCLNTNLIMLGAYDGEGYIFWEKDH